MINYMHRVITNPADMGGTTTGQATLTGANAVIQTLTAFRPMRIVRWGVVVTTTITGAGTFQLAGGVRVGPLFASGTTTAGSTATVQIANGYNSSNSPAFFVDTAGGTATIPNASLSSLTPGAVIYHNVNPQVAQTGGYYPAPDTAFIPPGGVSTQLWLAPGNSFQLTSVNAMTAGAVCSFIEVEEQAWTADFNNNQMLPAGFAGLSSILPTPSDPAQVAIFNAQA